MSKKDYIYLLAILIIILVGLFGYIHFSGELKSISNKLESTKNELASTKSELDQMKLRQKDTYLIYTMMKELYFRPILSNSSLISLAVLLNDREICNDVTDIDNKLCKDIFDGKCDEYEYPNREICATLNSMLERKVAPTEIISHCNNKNLIKDDMSQTHCFQSFAKMTNNINLCNEICKTPINNTNCKAFCRNDKNELVLCKEMYIKECSEYVLK